MTIPTRLSRILFYSTFLLALQPVTSLAESCSQTVQYIDSQHRKALDNYKPGSQDYLRALYAIEDGIFPSLKRCPRNAPLMAAMSELQLSLGQPPIALLYAQKALEFDPNSWQAHNAAGNALNVVEKYNEGLQHLQRASELQPDNYALLVNLCSSYERNKQHAKAILSCGRVIDKGLMTYVALPITCEPAPTTHAVNSNMPPPMTSTPKNLAFVVRLASPKTNRL